MAATACGVRLVRVAGRADSSHLHVDQDDDALVVERWWAVPWW